VGGREGFACPVYFLPCETDPKVYPVKPGPSGCLSRDFLLGRVSLGLPVHRGGRVIFQLAPVKFPLWLK